ncbi:MAG: (2Fe-2S)-binding protein [Bdellovibrionota bacterium]
MRNKSSDQSRLQLINIEVNGVKMARAVLPETTLLEMLRDELKLTGVKRGCDTGDCGCCSVLLDGKPVLSCILPACEVNGRKVTTIEGVAKDGSLHPVQESMIASGAIQCGFCTPAMVLNAVNLLEENKDPSQEEIKECVSGTVCRCTGYTKIENAVAEAAKKMRASDSP